QPPKPSIILSRESDTFVKGETLYIQCNSFGFYQTALFYLYKAGSEKPIAKKIPSARGYAVTFHFPNIDASNEGNYSCMYDVEVSGRLHNSARSDTAKVVVNEHLLKPQLRLNAVGQKLMKGQTMELACEVAYGFSGARFFLYKDGGPSPVASRLALSRSPRAHFTFNDISSANSGNYSCCYQVWIVGQQFNSSLSDPVNITVNDDVALRLVDGANDCSGTVQINYNGTWGSVCRDSWDIADAQVVCRQLGCGFARGQEGAPHLASAGVPKPVWLSTVRCRGGESHLWACQARAWSTTVTCSRGEVAGVTCAAQPPPPTALVVGGKLIFQDEPLRVTCTASPLYWGATMRLFQDGDPPSEVASGKLASSLSNVRFEIPHANSTGSGAYWCRYEMEIAELLFISERSALLEVTVLDDAKLRLAGGADPCSGRVELQYNGTWGTVCDSGWDRLDAEVVCRQLGCGFARAAVPGGHFGEGEGHPLLDNVRCNASERAIWSCPAHTISTSIGAKSCRQREGAGVICTDELPSPEISVLRSGGTFAQGETVLIRCSSPSYQTGGRFLLARAGAATLPVSMTAVAGFANVTFSLANVNVSDAGRYACMFQLEQNGKGYNSSWSDGAQVTVVEHPSKPEIETFRESGRYSVGEYVGIRCTAPAIFSGVIFLLLKADGTEPRLYRTAQSAGFAITFTIANISHDDSGRYRCLYQLKQAGALRNSSESDSVLVTVT
ncbi:deleted in malignant brain tumors 1 protein-like, partial [Chiloscyllium plagiosum]|uniref:deleted in malignant brain tumors 1 protein-like n=1 Tax=Chiloscyllium plagiosum TaxID=36176 RepID=UPI001CB8396D